MTAFPEFLTRKDIEMDKWEVTRGAPFVDVGKHTFSAPDSNNFLGRGIRLQQLVAAKIAPVEWMYDKYTCAPYDEDEDDYKEEDEEDDYKDGCGWERTPEPLPAAIVKAAHELHVNYLLRGMGESLDFLHTGGESKQGERFALSNDIESLITAYAPIHNTSAGDDMVAGVAAANPVLADYLRDLSKSLSDVWRQSGAEERSGTKPTLFFNSTDKEPYIHPANWSTTMEFTYSLVRHQANLTRRLAMMADHPHMECDEDISYSTHVGYWEKLEVAPIVLDKRVKGVHSRKPKPSDSGQVPRNISRLLTDPHKRVFTQRRRDRGGVVLIDQSGSMSLSLDDIWSIINLAPGATIIGYSHIDSALPNVWVHARNGRVVAEADMYHGGRQNAVDGPAVMYAARMRRRHDDPFIWVCDGMVTGRHDLWHDNLGSEAIAMVNHFDIHMCDDMEDAVKSLTMAAKGKRLHARLTGHLARHAASVAMSKSYP